MLLYRMEVYVNALGTGYLWWMLRIVRASTGDSVVLDAMSAVLQL